jgi:hypothetical protein
MILSRVGWTAVARVRPAPCLRLWVALWIAVGALSTAIAFSPAMADELSLQLRNSGDVPVQLSLVTSEGGDNVVGTLAAGEAQTVPVAIGWSFRALRDGVRVAEYTVSGPDGEWVIGAPPPPPAPPSARTIVGYDNPGGMPMELVRIEPDGREISFGTVEPGTIGAVNIEVGTVLGLKRGGILVATLVTTGSPGERLEAPPEPGPPPRGKPTSFGASNPTDAPAALFWVRADGVEVPMGDLPPRTGSIIQTAVGHRFLYRRDGKVVAEHTAGGDINDRFEVPAIPAPPLPSPGQPTSFIVANPTLVPADLFWLDPNGNEVLMGNVASRAEGPVATSVGHKFLLRSGGAVIATHVASGAPDDRFVVPGDSAPALGTPTVLTAANLTSGIVELIWIRPDGGETPMRVLQPGDVLEQVATRVGNRFVFRRDGQPLAEHVASGLAGDRFVAPHLLYIANYTDRPLELIQVGSDGREISRGPVSSGLASSIFATEGDYYVFKDGGQEIDRHLAADRPGNREFSVGQKPAVAPQFSRAPDRLSGTLVPTVDSIVADAQLNRVYQTYFTRGSNVALEHQLPDGQMTVVRFRTDAVAYVDEGGKSLRVRVATIDGSGLTLMQNGQPTLASGGSAGKWFVGNVYLNVRPANFGAFADTIWPKSAQEYINVSISNTLSWNATLSANANAGAAPGVGGGPSFGIGAASTKSVSSSVTDYQPSGTAVEGKVRYMWQACGIADKPKTTDNCSYREPADIYDETTASLRVLKPITLAWPILSSDTEFVVTTPKADLPDWLLIEFYTLVRYDRVWLEAKNDELNAFGSGVAIVFRPDQWGAEKSPAFLKHANQNVKSENTIRSSTLTIALDIRELKRELK